MDRFMTAIRTIIREEFPNLSYLGTYEYSVVGSNEDGSINATATDPAISMPNLNNIPIRSGAEGATAKPTPGNLCYVRFINGDPTRPIVVGNQAIVDTLNIDATNIVRIGQSVSEAVIIAGGDAPVARDGDTVTVYFGSAGSISATGMLSPGQPSQPGSFSGTISFDLPATGVITSGQSKVLA